PQSSRLSRSFRGQAVQRPSRPPSIRSVDMGPDRGEVTNFEQRLTEVADKVTVALDQLIPPASGPEANLMRAMRHAALANGKRMRPFFVLETGAMFGASEKSLLRTAAALECIHCYSLVHDDLPCMDNDDFRRGKPSNHKAYGEGMAVLAGDALNTHAYQVLVDHYKDQPQLCVELVSLLARASGVQGMVGGQALDMNPTLPANLSEMEKIFRMKTGALFEASALGSALVCGANETQAESLKSFGASLGVF